jgi:NAD(P)-dependent dehydrogenase (short-subunit alcohol dehydrogenase family)
VPERTVARSRTLLQRFVVRFVGSRSNGEVGRIPTIAVTGAASGLGAATVSHLVGHGHRVIGVDLRDADVICDLGTPAGRQQAVDQVTAACGGTLDGLVTFAGLAGLTGRPASLLVSVNYFGTIELLRGLRAALEAGREPAAVAISSNSTTCQPGWRQSLVDACLAGDEEQARSIADQRDSIEAYPATKAAVARWIRRQAPTGPWAGSGIRLNAIAPGLIETPMTEEIQHDSVLGELIGQFPVPVGRAGRPEEVAALAGFLLGPDARFFCGSVVFMDGGTDALLRPDDWPAVWGAPPASGR